jgi:hypothetical protein
MSKFRLLIAAVLVAVAASGLARAQSRPSATVTRSTGTNIVVAVSTNAITLVSTNFSDGTFRLKVLVQNTNTAGSVAIYKGTNATAAIEAVLAPGQAWISQWPVIYNGVVGARSTGAALPVIVSEDWGQ